MGDGEWGASNNTTCGVQASSGSPGRHSRVLGMDRQLLRPGTQAVSSRDVRLDAGEAANTAAAALLSSPWVSLCDSTQQHPPGYTGR